MFIILMGFLVRHVNGGKEMGETIIRTATIKDICQIAVIHKSQFSTHFLGHYSIGLIEKYYLNFLEACIFLVSESSGTINGFVLGGRSKELNRAKNNFIENNKLRYILETIFRPKIYIQALKRIKSVGVIRESASSPVQGSFSLLSIAIMNELAGSGIAVKLVQEFEHRLSPISEYSLYVRKTNKRAINFYYKNGFKLVKDSNDCLHLIKKIVVPKISKEETTGTPFHRHLASY